MTDHSFDALVNDFGTAAKVKLAGVGEPEEALRGPIETLISAIGAALGKAVILEGEARLADIGARPDFAVRVSGAIVGYLEVKKPGLSIDAATFSGDNKRQWERLRGLPNLIYTNGIDWRLYRDGAMIVESRLTGGAVSTAGAALTPADSGFAELVTAFLSWVPVPIRTTSRLVQTVAPITRLLREKVTEQMQIEAAEVAGGASLDDQVFLGLASDWRALLFPNASDEVFADGYAQTVTFALLLAKTEGVSVSDANFYDIGKQLMLDHSLMGRALQLLTERMEPGFGNTTELLARVIDAVDWNAVRKSKDTYLHLYEHFLDAYDPDLRKATGTYFTPHQVVDEMVRLTEEVLRRRLDKPKAFLDETVTTIDPAMGTGTFLHSIIESAAADLLENEGPGLVSVGVSELAKRLIGFEMQLGSYAVAQLRTTDLLRSYGATVPSIGLRTFVADTLSDPHAADQQIASGLGAISASRKAANKVKAEVPVTVVIGNPPYRAKAEGQGGWVESGSTNATGSAAEAPLDAFRLPGNGGTEFNLKNLYIYFWRWATWKVFESVPADRVGVVTFITSSAYISGPGFKGMRDYLRRNASEGWIIDLTPEGKRPPAANAIFAIETPVAIGIFVRRPDNDLDSPAPVHFLSLSGVLGEKLAKLAAVDIDSAPWVDADTDWAAPFTPGAGGDWNSYPALDDLIPWRGPGIAANRAWVYSPDKETLVRRWATVVSEKKHARKEELFHPSRDATLVDVPARLPGNDTTAFGAAFNQEKRLEVEPVQVGFRSLDRQWIIPDARLLHAPSPPLWSARIAGQVFLGEQHSVRVPEGASPISFSAFIPDLNYTDNRGGRTLPMLHPDGTPNAAPGLLPAISTALGFDVTIEDLYAYIAGVVDHAGFSETFQEELRTPGVRVPITKNPDLWRRAVAAGETAIWLQTFGASFANPSKGRLQNDPRSGLPASDRIFSLTPVTELPDAMSYNEDDATLRFVSKSGGADGSWGPVRPEVLDYKVGNLAVVQSWFDYRRREPIGRRSSPLDDIVPVAWPAAWSIEFTELLTVVTRLLDLEQEQRAILTEVMSDELWLSSDLVLAGATWPSGKKDRRPRKKATASDQLDGLDI